MPTMEVYYIDFRLSALLGWVFYFIFFVAKMTPLEIDENHYVLPAKCPIVCDLQRLPCSF